MPETFRTRDCVVFFKGDTYPVQISSDLAIRGWVGGQGVQWVSSEMDDFVVTFSDGLYAGFLLYGSDEPSDRYTSWTRNQQVYNFSTCCAGGWLVAFRTYEKYTYASRVGGGPLVPISYKESDRLVFSLRGLLTNEDEWSLSGDPRAPNNYYIAFVAQAPTAENDYYLTVQTSI